MLSQRISGRTLASSWNTKTSPSIKNLSNIVDPSEVVASSFNVDTLILCPSYKGQIGILREAIATASYIGLRHFNGKRLPDCSTTCQVTLST